MTRHHRRVMAAAGMLLALSAAPAALAQKSRSVLRQYIIDSPASMSIHEETTVVAERPMMAVMSNLVLFDQHVPQNSLSDILPDLATDWAWDEDGTRLTLHLRQGVKWHDGKPFTAADVKCTWDLVQGKGPERLRVNPRKAWYNNLSEVVPNGDYEVTFELKRPQRRLSRCSPRACPRSIRAMSRRRRCASIQSAPARSNSSNSGPTSSSRW